MVNLIENKTAIIKSLLGGMKGRTLLICVDGVDEIGKSTYLKHLQLLLENNGISANVSHAHEGEMDIVPQNTCSYLKFILSQAAQSIYKSDSEILLFDRGIISNLGYAMKRATTLDSKESDDYDRYIKILNFFDGVIYFAPDLEDIDEKFQGDQRFLNYAYRRLKILDNVQQSVEKISALPRAQQDLNVLQYIIDSVRFTTGVFWNDT